MITLLCTELFNIHLLATYFLSKYTIDALSTGVVAVITAVVSCIVSVIVTAIITFVITTHYHKRKYSNKQITVKQPIVSQAGVMEYEEIKRTSSPDNVAMTHNPSYDVAMTGNPAYGHNVKTDPGSDYYN